jgi:hypothetical protein
LKLIFFLPKSQYISHRDQTSSTYRGNRKKADLKHWQGFFRVLQRFPPLKKPNGLFLASVIQSDCALVSTSLPGGPPKIKNKKHI